MRNKFPGICYVCGGRVLKGAGHFERRNHGTERWRLQCASHAVEKKITGPELERWQEREKQKYVEKPQ